MRPTEIIVKDPDILGGTPVFRGTRVPVRANLAGRNIAILIVRAKSNRLADLLPHAEACRSVLSSIQPGQV